MTLRAAFMGSTLLATLAAPAIARAGTVLPEPGTVRVASPSVVNLRTLAASAANRAALAATAGRMIVKPAHRYPTATGAARASVPPAMADATVSVVGNAVVQRKGVGFNGIDEGSNAAAIGGDLEPPDQGLAADNGQVVEVVNDSVQVFNTKGGELSATISNYAFFGLDPNADSIGDPHVEYDASVQRWFFTTYDISGSFNGYIVAASTSSDPLGSYYVYKITANPAKIKGCVTSCFGDYPQPGYDANGYYLAADLFSNVTGRFVDAEVNALPKALLIKGASFNYNYFLFPDFVVEPSIPAVPGAFDTAASGTELLMTARNIEDGSSNLRVYAISDTAAIGQASGLIAHSVDVAAESYTATVPSTEPNVVGPYGMSVGATSSPQLDGGYNAFGGGVKYLNGSLYAALATGTTDGTGLARDVIAWFQVTAAATSTAVTASIAGQGYIVPPNGYSITYPGFALNAKAEGIIGTTITNPSKTVPGGFPSAGFVTFAGGKPSTTYRVSGQGSASDDGFTGYSGSTATIGRWGDFSSATTDPQTGKFYVGNEYIPNAAVYPRTTFANWGTFITRLP